MLKTIELYGESVVKTVYGKPVSYKPRIEVFEDKLKLVFSNDPVWSWHGDNSGDLVGMWRVAEVVGAIDGNIKSPNLLFIFCAVSEVSMEGISKSEAINYLLFYIKKEDYIRIMNAPVPDSIRLHLKNETKTSQ
jgi:hypothetical protein